MEGRVTEIEKALKAIDERLAIYSLALWETEELVHRTDLGGWSLLEQVGHQRPSLMEIQRCITQTEDRYRTLGEILPFGVWIADSDGRFITVSQSFLDMLGITLQELRDCDWSKLGSPVEAEAVRSLWLETAKSGTFWNYEFTIRDRLGASRTIASRGIPVRDEYGRTVFWVGLNLDLTERRQAEALRTMLDEARSSLDRLQAIFATMEEGVVAMDLDGNVFSANPAALRLHGVESLGRFPWSVQELAQLFGVQHPDGRPMPLEEWPLLRAVRGETFSAVDVLVHRRDTGFERNIRYSGAPVCNAAGVPFMAMLTVCDTTEQKAADRWRQDYISMISHDLRSPLTVIIGQAGILRSKLAKEGRSELVESIEAINIAGKRMDRMIKELVESARLESGVLKLDMRPISPADIMSGVLQKAIAPEQVDRIRLSLDEALPSIVGDAEQLERVLTNLISNALKYSPDGCPVEVSVSSGEEHILFAVKDQGPGIRPHDLPHIFDRFYRAKDRQPSDGMGMGLYISKLIAQAHSGRIWVESEPGKGCTFYFTLPA